MSFSSVHVRNSRLHIAFIVVMMRRHVLLLELGEHLGEHCRVLRVVEVFPFKFGANGIDLHLPDKLFKPLIEQ